LFNIIVLHLFVRIFTKRSTIAQLERIDILPISPYSCNIETAHIVTQTVLLHFNPLCTMRTLLISHYDIFVINIHCDTFAINIHGFHIEIAQYCS